MVENSVGLSLFQPKVKHILGTLAVENFHLVHLNAFIGEENTTAFDGFAAVTDEAVYFHFWPIRRGCIQDNTQEQVLATHGEEKISVVLFVNGLYPAVITWKQCMAWMTLQTMVSFEKALEDRRLDTEGAGEAGSLQDQMNVFSAREPDAQLWPFALKGAANREGFLIYRPGKTLSVHIDGFGEMTAVNGQGESMLFEYFLGLFRLHYWDNINSEDSQEILPEINSFVIVNWEQSNLETHQIVCWAEGTGWTRNVENMTIYPQDAPATTKLNKEHLPNGGSWFPAKSLVYALGMNDGQGGDRYPNSDPTPENM
jgi:hypothetical protein